MTQSTAKKYQKIKLYISLLGLLIDVLFWIILITSGWASSLAAISRRFSSHFLIQFYFFVVGLGVINLFIHLPLSFYSGYLVEHRFALSNQTFWRWVIEQLKGLLLGLILGGITLTIFYLILWRYPHFWWLLVWAFMLFFSVVLGQLAPLVIFPLFYKFKPLENEDLKQRIQKLAENWKIKISGVFQFDLSKNTRKANAALIGLGKTRRVVLGDTLLTLCSPSEIETVFAHEIGHHVQRHMLKGILFSSLISLIGLWISFQIYQTILVRQGYAAHQLDALPYLGLIFVAYGLFTTPLTNYISRHFEYQADRFAAQSTHREDFVNALQKLAESNLADKTPHPIVEFLFYSHPSINHRIEKIKGTKI